MIRFRETRGRSWRGSQPGTREWESRSVSYGLFCRLSWLFCAGVWYLAFPLWLAAELCMLAASALVVLPGGPSAQIALRPRSRQAAC